MKCKDIEKLIPLYARNLLEESIKQKVERHLENCPKCHRLLELEKKITEDLIEFLDFQAGNQKIKFPEKRRNYLKMAGLIAALFIAAFAFFFSLSEKSGGVVKIKEIAYSSPQIKNIVRIDRNVETKVKKIDKNIYVIEILRR